MRKTRSYNDCRPNIPAKRSRCDNPDYFEPPTVKAKTSFSNFHGNFSTCQDELTAMMNKLTLSNSNRETKSLKRVSCYYESTVADKQFKDNAKSCLKDPLKYKFEDAKRLPRKLSLSAQSLLNLSKQSPNGLKISKPIAAISPLKGISMTPDSEDSNSR